MTGFDFTAKRLFVRAPLSAGGVIDLDRDQVNRLTNVLRLKAGDGILAFNGRDGEWTARLVEAGRRRWRLEVVARARVQTPAPDLHYLFAPLRQARLDYIVQKAVEMGVGRLSPVLTRHGQVVRPGHARMAANAVAAAEQCGILSIPVIDEPVSLATVLDTWSARQPGRRLVFCDEGAADADPLAILAGLAAGSLAVLVGPEGGFAGEERARLNRLDFVTALPLGPRILRADTAAVAALALVQAALGDWRRAPPAPH